MDDSFYIKRTLRLAKKGLGHTSPNPMVGAVIVKNGRIIAEAFHQRPGFPHAEALALEKAGSLSKGSVLYVNLEPCCHTKKRTPPCTQAIIRAGVKTVVASMIDPNPNVSGKGLKELRQAGIQVTTGIGQEEARRLNESYIKFITTGKPFVILKTAMTLDGKIATPKGQSRWITDKKAREKVHMLRSSVDAVLTAIGTVKADDPELTARIRKRMGKNPVRVLIDPKLEVNPDAQILKMPPETIIVTEAPLSKRKYLESKGIQCIQYKEKLDLNRLMVSLGERQITSVLIEGGSSLNAHALEEEIVDKVMFFIAPKIIGGAHSFPAVGGRTFQKLENAYHVQDMHVRKIGEDFLAEGYIYHTL